MKFQQGLCGEKQIGKSMTENQDQKEAPGTRPGRPPGLLIDAARKVSSNHIPDAIANAAVSLLGPYCPGLTTERLCTVISYQPESRTEPLKTRRQASQALGVSLPTIDRMLRDGDLPKRRIRGAVRIPASAIDHFILQGGR